MISISSSASQQLYGGKLEFGLCFRPFPSRTHLLPCSFNLPCSLDIFNSKLVSVSIFCISFHAFHCPEEHRFHCLSVAFLPFSQHPQFITVKAYSCVFLCVIYASTICLLLHKHGKTFIFAIPAIFAAEILYSRLSTTIFVTIDSLPTNAVFIYS